MDDMNTLVDDVTTDVDTDIDTTDDSGASDPIKDEGVALLKKYKVDVSNFEEKDLLAMLARLERAEGVKRQEKSQKKESSEPTTKYLTEADLERRDFLKANPELSDYSKELETYSKKGLSLDEAKVLIMNSDKARINREKLNSLGLSDGETSKGTKTYSDEDLVALSKKDINSYNRAMNDIESGKAKHK